MAKPHFRLAELVRQGRARTVTASRLAPLEGFGANPGALTMWQHVPEGLPAGAPLVVALHGCTQDAAGYAAGSGWVELADRHGFALLLPEQGRSNNANRCFNWFEPGDIRRDQGEAASIRQGLAAMLAQHGLDARRVFVTGLSAGGAMASVMLATYPEVFAAGAIIAGLPHGAASSMPEAFEAMASTRPRPAADWAALVRAASPHRGPWPRVAVWQGAADTTVRPVNAGEITKQWLALHGLDGAPATVPATAGHAHAVWRDAAGVVRVERHDIAGMGHGVPVDGAAGVGRAGPYFLDVGVSSSQRIAAFFGIAAAEAARPLAPSALVPRGGVIAIGRDGAARVETPVPPGPQPEARPAPEGWAGTDPGQVIRRALTAAGLLKG